LDFESTFAYSIVVNVYDMDTTALPPVDHTPAAGSIETFRDTVRINIAVLDENDETPIFDADVGQRVIFENAPVGTVVATPYATDRDSTAGFNVVSYSIVGGNAGNTFTIDSMTGGITTFKPLDREDISSYTLTIQALDNGLPTGLSSTIDIVVEVQDVNDNYPVFERISYQMGVLENATISSPIGRVQAEDQDTGLNAELRYSLENVANNAFSVDRSSGTIRVAKLLDREVQRRYSFVAVAVDQASPFLVSRLIFTVLFK
jgi:hypothetical protein